MFIIRPNFFSSSYANPNSRDRCVDVLWVSGFRGASDDISWATLFNCCDVLFVVAFLVSTCVVLLHGWVLGSISLDSYRGLVPIVASVLCVCHWWFNECGMSMSEFSEF